MPGVKGKSGRKRKPLAELERIGSKSIFYRKKVDGGGWNAKPDVGVGLIEGTLTPETVRAALIQAGVVTPVDTLLVESMIHSYSEYQRVSKLCKEFPVVDIDQRGKRHANPLFEERRAILDQLLRMWDALKMSPTSRGIVAEANGKKTNDDESFTI